MWSREGIAVSFSIFHQIVGYIGVGCCSVSCSEPRTQLSLLSMEMLWLSKGNLNSLEAKGEDEQRERLAQKGERSWDRGWGRASEDWAGLSRSTKGSQPQTRAWEVQGQHSLPRKAVQPRDQPQRGGVPTLGSARLGWAGPQLALSGAGDSPAPKGGWMGALFPSSTAGMVLEDLS